MTGFFLEAARLYLSAYGDNPCPFGAKIQTTYWTPAPGLKTSGTGFAGVTAIGFFAPDVDIPSLFHHPASDVDLLTRSA